MKIYILLDPIWPHTLKSFKATITVKYCEEIASFFESGNVKKMQVFTLQNILVFQIIVYENFYSPRCTRKRFHNTSN